MTEATNCHLFKSYNCMREIDLVKNCLAGDQKACKQLYLEYAPTMLSLCHRYITHTAEAEDALQEGFIKIFQNLKGWNQTGPLGAWIRRIMINTCLSNLRKNGQLQTFDPADGNFDPSVEPDVLFSLDYNDFENILKKMPAGYRTVFNLVVLEGYSYVEISNLLNIKEVSCRSQYFKAKQFLTQKLQSLYPHIKLPA